MNNTLRIALVILFAISTSLTEAQTWSAVAAGSGSVNAMTVYNGELYVATGYYVKKWDGANWTTVGNMLSNYGCNCCSGGVLALTTLNGNLYAGGNFSAVNGIPDTAIARWDGSNWYPIGGSFHDRMALSLGTDSYNLYGDINYCDSAKDYLHVGDDYGLYPNSNYPAVYGYSIYNNQFYISARGGVCQYGSLTPLDGSPGGIVSFTVGNNNLFAGGGTDLGNGYVYQWDGSNWSALGIGFEDGFAWAPAVTSVAVYNGSIYAAGSFKKAEGHPASYIAMWDGNKWWPVGSGTDGFVLALTVFNGDLYVGGQFSSAGGIPVNGIAKLSGCPAAILSDTTVTCTGDSIKLMASAGTAYQWKLNGTPIPGATTSSYHAKSAGDFTCIVTNNICSNTSNTITVNSPPSASITASGLTTFCDGDSVLLTASTGNSYLWSAGETTQSITVKTTGSYSCAIGGSCGISVVSTLVTVNPSPIANFDINPDPNIQHHYIAVNNSTGNALKYLWSWGDGTQDSIPYPSHTYAAAGFYNICLTIIDSTDSCSSTACDSSFHIQRSANPMIYIDVVPAVVTGINTPGKGKTNLSIYPNPFSTRFIIECKDQKATTLIIYNTLGQVMYNQKAIGSQTIINMDGEPSGIYYLRITTDNKGTINKKIVKQ